MSSLVVAENSSITLNFALLLDDGTEVDSNLDGEPVAMQIGDGNMLPGFERCLLGLAEGENVETLVKAEDAFGDRNQDNIQWFKASDFTGDLNLEQGLVVSFADPGGGELPGVVRTVEAERVEIDFNHPLAGRNIVFKAVVHTILENHIDANSSER